MNICEVTVDEVQKHGSSILIGEYLLVIVEQDDPPMKSSPIYLTSPSDLDMS